MILTWIPTRQGASTQSSGAGEGRAPDSMAWGWLFEVQPGAAQRSGEEGWGDPEQVEQHAGRHELRCVRDDPPPAQRTPSIQTTHRASVPDAAGQVQCKIPAKPSCLERLQIPEPARPHLDPVKERYSKHPKMKSSGFFQDSLDCM